MSSPSAKQVFYTLNTGLGDELISLSEEEELGFVFYLAEKERRKPGFLRRVGERVHLVARVFYPLAVKKVSGTHTAIYDLVKEGEVVVEYPVIDKSVVESIVAELESTSSEQVVEKLVYAQNRVESMIKRREGLVSRKVSLGPMITDPELVRELGKLLNRVVKYKEVSYTPPYKQLNLDAYVERINAMNSEISEMIAFVNSIITRLKKVVDSSIEYIREKYSKSLAELEKRLKEVEEEVKAKISELQSKKSEEVRRVRESYEKILSEMNSRIEELRKELEKLEEEEAKAKQYGGDVKEVKRRKSTIEKELESLEKRRKEYEKKLEEETADVERKYSELIEAERERVKTLESEKKRLESMAENLVNQLNKRYESIRETLLSYIDTVKSAEKRVFDALIPTPQSGEGVYCITLYVVAYASSKNHYRVIVHYPSQLYPKGVFRSVKYRFFEKTRDYLEEFSKAIADAKNLRLLETANLAKTIPVERIELGLSMLCEKHVIDRKDAESVIDSLRKQLR